MRLRPFVKASVISGFLAGLVMMLIEIFYSWCEGLAAWEPLEWVGASAFGKFSHGEPRVLLAGCLIHMLVTTLWGFLFALLIHRSKSSWHVLGWGIPWGVGVWAIMTYVVLPLKGTALLAQVRNIPEAWLLFHMAYGASLAMTPWLMRRLTRRPTRPVLVTW